MNKEEYSDLSYQDVIDANIEVHTKMSAEYNNEPHFRPESVARVEKILSGLVQKVQASRLLDLGCGTGFMIDIAKKYVSEVHGVDVTVAMMEQVDTSGDCKVVLHEHDTGSFDVQKEYFDIATGYSFLHHLRNIEPTLKTAYAGLKTGGVLYCDLDPNYHFWNNIHALERGSKYDAIVNREIEMVVYKDEDVQKTFGVSKGVFDSAEYGKNIAGGLQEEVLGEQLRSMGFSNVEFFYHWFIGQAQLINNKDYGVEERFKYADVMNDMLQRVMPMSRNLFKYIGVIATK